MFLHRVMKILWKIENQQICLDLKLEINYKGARQWKNGQIIIK